MSTVKTAISIESNVFAEVDNVARELNLSRSRVIGLALEEFLKRRENQRLLEQMNAALAEIVETPEDRQARATMKRKQREIVGRESW